MTIRQRTSVVLRGPVFLSMLIAGALNAAPILTPPSLSPGDSYQLLFVTSALVDARTFSTNISAYDAFVQNVANLAGLNTINGQPVTWLAIGSTDTTNAKDHDIQSAAIYNLQAQLLFPPGTLWVDITQPHVPVLYNEFGTAEPFPVYTGTLPSGLGASGSTLGGDPLIVIGGFANLTGEPWVDDGGLAGALPLYALSSPITVVPEPSAIQLLVVGLATLAISRAAGGNGARAGRNGFIFPGLDRPPI